MSQTANVTLTDEEAASVSRLANKLGDAPAASALGISVRTLLGVLARRPTIKTVASCIRYHLREIAEGEATQ